MLVTGKVYAPIFTNIISTSSIIDDVLIMFVNIGAYTFPVTSIN